MDRTEKHTRYQPSNNEELETDTLTSHISQPGTANPNHVSVFHSNSHAAVTGKQTASTVLPPFSGELRVDKELKLSHDNFKESIEQFYANKQLSAIDQLKETAPYPTPNVLAQFANMAYRDCKHGDPEPPDGWQLLTTASNSGIKNGYFGTAYWHPEHQQVVIAHRGADIKNVDALVTDITDVLFNNYVPQMSSASTFANKVVAVLQVIEQEKKVSFELFFTGHSLGGWLAQITAFTTEYLDVTDSYEVQKGWKPMSIAFITKPVKSKTDTFPKELKREDHDPPASSSGQSTHDVTGGWQAQVTASNTAHIEEKGGTNHKKRKREDHDPPASTAVQNNHDVREGWQEQVTVCNTVPIEEKGGTYHKKRKREEHLPTTSRDVQESHDVRHRYHPHTVVFDSPGCKDMLSKMADKIDVRINGRSIDLQHLDITSYLCAPNRINTCNLHVGTVYRILNLRTHSMDKIVQAFNPEEGKEKDDNDEPKILEVVDWPISAGLTGGAEYNDFFKLADSLNNYDPQVTDNVSSEVPKGYHPLHYQTKAYDECKKSLSVFTHDEREFLERYRWLRHVPEFFQAEDLFSVIHDVEEERKAEQKLREFEVEDESVRCPDACTLHMLIPYVKRLVRLFPQLKDKLKDQLSSAQIKNRVYQYETQCYVEKIRQSALDFNNRALGLREFLTSDQQMWQLRMVDGDAWTGITKVYRVLQKTFCTPNYSSEGHYTILKLKRLLTVNRIIKLNALLAEMETPHLLMIACGKHQAVNDEVKDMFQELLNTLKQKSMKIILTTQSEDTTFDFLRQIASKILGKGMKTTDEMVTWNELTDCSKSKMFEKKVIFQGISVTLNEISSAVSMGNSFPLADFLHEKELRIGEEPVSSASSGYNEKFYIDRTFNHNIVIRQDIEIDKTEGKFADLLASTEQEFKQLSKQKPTINVHWLEKDKSGELIWQQTKGNLRTIRKYIDAHTFQRYVPRDLDKLLQQAKKQRVMLIADTAGIGKTTVLTHLAKRIKQKNPAHWLVRIDLNDYTELLKAQKGKKIDKGWVLEFVSKEVLKLESRLEKELFKKCFEGDEISKVVVMVDGFNELSPNHKETVLDMLQVLKQTSLEQLWVTTRTHLKEDLEDNLQQLSYTLQPFSEGEHVEFLKKFWHEKLSLEDKDQDRLQIYAQALITKSAQSISDKDKQFTGIPLQTCMLAEAFEKDFRSFYGTKNSEPELPKKLELVGLYGRFIDRKYEIYYREKSKASEGNMAVDEQQERDSKYIQLEHQILALEVFFSKHQVTLLQIGDNSTLSDEEMARIGIVQRNCEGNPNFIHRTFAEYYVADVLLNDLTKKTKPRPQVQEFFLSTILLQADCHVIRAFLDGLLKKSNETKEALRECGENLDEQWYMNKENTPLIADITTLRVAAKEGNVNILEFLIDTLKSGERFSVVTKLLLDKDHQGNTAWHEAAEGGHVEVLDNLWDWAKELQLKPEELRNEMFLSRNKFEKMARYKAEESDQVEISEKLWVWVKELQLKPEELRNEMLLSKDKCKKTAWHKAAEGGHVEVLNKLWDWAKELQLKPEELRNELLLSRDKYEKTVWHKAAFFRKVELLEKLWNLAKQLQLKPEELRNELFSSKGMYPETAWHIAAKRGHVELLEKLWDWAKDLKLEPEELRNEVLLSKDFNSDTAWQNAAEMGHVEVLNKLWDWAKELQLNPEELRYEMLLSKDKCKKTAWHMAAEGSHVEVLNKLWDWAKELQLNREELRYEMLLSKDKCKKTAWHMAAEGSHVEVLNKLWDWAKELQLNPEELRYEMLLSKDKCKKTAWHMAAEGSHVEVLNKLWDWAKELQLKPEELKKRVLLSKNDENKSIWHIAADTGQFEILEELWNWAKEIKLRTKELRNDLLLSKDYLKETVWHKAAKIGHVAMLDNVWHWAKELKLKPEEIRNEMLLSKDKPKKTAWHKAAERGHVEVLNKLWDWAKELQLKPEELRNEMLLSKDQYKQMVWHKAAGSGQVEILEKLWDWAKELQLKEEELRNEMLLSKGKFKKTAGHKAAESGHVKVLNKLWDWAKELQLKPEDLRNEMLLLKDQYMQTAWQMGAESGQVEILEKLWDWAKELQLKPEELKNEVLFSKDKLKETVWHKAAASGQVEILQKLCDCAKELQLNREELINDVLLSKDKDEEAFWHRLAKCGQVEILDKLWNWAKELQLKPEELKNEVLFSKDKLKETAWHKAAASGQVEILQKLWDWAKELQLNREELINDVLLSKDKDEEAFWHRVAKDGQFEILEKLWDWAKELQLKTEELRS